MANFVRWLPTVDHENPRFPIDVRELGHAKPWQRSELLSAAVAWDRWVGPVIDLQHRLWSDRLDEDWNWASIYRLWTGAYVLSRRCRTPWTPRAFAIFPRLGKAPKFEAPIALILLGTNCPHHDGQHPSVFVDWLSSAPRAAVALLTGGADGYAYHLGRAALDVAVSLSVEVGGEGRAWLRAFKSPHTELNRALAAWYRRQGMENLKSDVDVPPRYGYIQPWNNGRLWAFDVASAKKFRHTLDPQRK